MNRHLRIYDHFAIPHLSNTATAWCPGAAAGPGRASRSTTPSRRLACGDLAGVPPPTGTWTIGSAAVTREALHPLRGVAPNQKGCNANRWGARPHRQQAVNVYLPGWKAPLDLLGLRDPAGPRDRPLQAAGCGTLTVGRTAPGWHARRCRYAQPLHRPPSYHPAQPSAGALGPRRRGSQSRGSRATGG